MTQHLPLGGEPCLWVESPASGWRALPLGEAVLIEKWQACSCSMLPITIGSVISPPWQHCFIHVPWNRMGGWVGGGLTLTVGVILREVGSESRGQ